MLHNISSNNKTEWTNRCKALEKQYKNLNIIYESIDFDVAEQKEKLDNIIKEIEKVRESISKCESSGNNPTFLYFDIQKSLQNIEENLENRNNDLLGKIDEYKKSWKKKFESNCKYFDALKAYEAIENNASFNELENNIERGMKDIANIPKPENKLNLINKIARLVENLNQFDITINKLKPHFKIIDQYRSNIDDLNQQQKINNRQYTNLLGQINTLDEFNQKGINKNNYSDFIDRLAKLKESLNKLNPKKNIQYGTMVDLPKSPYQTKSNAYYAARFFSMLCPHFTNKEEEAAEKLLANEKPSSQFGSPSKS